LNESFLSPLRLQKEGTWSLQSEDNFEVELLEDDGIEDLHFYQVAFNKHTEDVLNKMGHKDMLKKGYRKKMYDNGVIDCEEDLLKMTKTKNPIGK